eukprot:3755331-Ditylum_brightwellii.AAC.1
MPPEMDTAFSAAVKAEEKGIMGKDLRLHELMKNECGTHMELSSFEPELIYNFERDKFICKSPNKIKIQVVQAICDWVWEWSEQSKCNSSGSARI